jgi:hypothetical protein
MFERSLPMQNIIDALAGIRIGEPATYRNLSVFPLFGVDLKNAGYITLDEALERKCSVVTEVSEGGSVPELKFVNAGAPNVPTFDDGFYDATYGRCPQGHMRKFDG